MGHAADDVRGLVLDRVFDRFIPDGLAETERFKARVTVGANLVLLLGAFPAIGWLLSMGFYDSVVAVCVGGCGYLVPLELMRTGRLRAAAWVLSITLTFNITVGIWLGGGLSGASMLAFLVTGIFASLVQGPRPGFLWLGIQTLLMGGFVVANRVEPGIGGDDVGSFLLVGVTIQALLATHLRLLDERARQLAIANRELQRAHACTKQLAEELEYEKQHLDTIVQNLPVAICLADRDGHVVHRNPLFAKFAEYNEDLVNRSAAETKGPPTSSDETWALGDGAAEVLVRRVRVDHGQGGASVLVVGLDVTERRTLEKELDRARQLEAIGQLAAGVAHEINTPIQYVSDNTRFLRDSFTTMVGLVRETQRVLGDGVTDNHAALAARIDEADVDYLAEDIPAAIAETLAGLERVAEIVAGLKNLAHLGTDITEADVNEAIATTVAVTRNEWKYSARCELDLDPGLGPIHCRLSGINQLLVNLVVNAGHAVADRFGDGGQGRIRISTRRVDDDIEIVVADNGCGMPPEVMERIFQPFFTTKEVGKGTGQGLAVVHRIVEDHHGRIQVDSKVGEGSTFRITLPRHALQDAA